MTGWNGGYAKCIRSRSGTVIRAWTAVLSRPSTSPPYGDTTVPPTTTPLPASATTLTTPVDPEIQPRGAGSMSAVPVTTARPAERADASVCPTCATSGSV